MRSEVLYLTASCIIFFLYFETIGTAEFPSINDKPQVVEQKDLENIESRLLTLNYSIFCQLMYLIKLLNLFNSLNKTFTTKNSKELEVLLSAEENVRNKHAEIRNELLKRGVDLLSCINVNSIKRFSELNSKLANCMYSDTSNFIETVLELNELTLSLMQSITSFRLETFVSDGFSTENVRDLLLSISENFSTLILDVSQQNENQLQRKHTDENSTKNFSPNFVDGDLYLENASNTPQSFLQGKKSVSSVSNQPDKNNQNNEPGKNKKSRGKNRKNVSSVGNKKINMQVSEENKRGEFKGAGPNNSSSSKEQNNASGSKPLKSEKGSNKETQGTKKQTSKKKHLENHGDDRQPQNVLVRHAESVRLDASGGAKQKVRGDTKQSKKKNRSNSRSSRSPSPRPHTSARLQAGSSSYRRSPSPRPHTSAELQAGLPLRIRSKSRSRRRSRSRRTSSATRRSESAAREGQIECNKLESYSALFLVQEAEENLSELLALEAELLNLSYDLYKLFLEMNQMYQEIKHKGSKFTAVKTQIKILNTALKEWLQKMDFGNHEIKYVFLNAREVIASIPPSVAARQGLASRVCGSKDCCKVNQPGDKHIVGFNNCGCDKCDCSCIFCSPYPYNSEKRSIYDVD
ncbi:signal peptide protein [Cryptosporidium sp. chipmunk genotype I]|uniref:signal peptide protein n=1 Tax=Cryptosporidium sp. chipmunk genotype I TaxID=1280935 RepID=UPI00351A3E44|nr:signal peptide protein [Cryptosporidium sp. chipmunk genotype I]